MIREAKKKDIKEIADLMIEEFSKFPFNEKESLNSVLKSLNFYFKIGKGYVAIDENKITGVVIFKIEQYWEGQAIIIEDLAVKEKSVGKMLLDKVEDYAKKHKFKKILFKTNKKDSAIKFYEECEYNLRADIIEFEKKIS